MILVHFIFILDDVLKKWKFLHDTGTSTNTIDNNEVNTNVTVQMTYMHKTKTNQNETNVSPLVKLKIKWYVTGKSGNINIT